LPNFLPSFALTGAARPWRNGVGVASRPVPKPHAHNPPEVPLAKPVKVVPRGPLASLRREAADCRACPLWRGATQTVFGEGPQRAPIMLIGEQPGAQEDLEGRPFVGPAGKMLDQALEAAGLDRKALYLTNTVKHFKYEMRGKRRLHKSANASEQAACRMWLAAELLRVQPRIVVGLGSMAARTMFGAAFRITLARGEWRELGRDVRGIATWHPSALLRMPDAQSRAAALREMVEDLRKVAEAAREPVIRHSGASRTNSSGTNLNDRRSAQRAKSMDFVTQRLEIRAKALGSGFRSR
jgi:DNA polymerase